MTGRLWLDDRKTVDVAERVLGGAQHYATKYNEFYRYCHVHPSMAAGIEQVGPVKVVADADFPTDYFWFCNEEE